MFGETTISIEVSNISGWIWEVECFSLIAYKASKAIYVSLQQVWGLQRLLAHAAQMAACAFRVGLRSSIGDSEKSVEKRICFGKNCAYKRVFWPAVVLRLMSTKIKNQPHSHMLFTCHANLGCKCYASRILLPGQSDLCNSELSDTVHHIAGLYAKGAPCQRRSQVWGT